MVKEIGHFIGGKHVTGTSGRFADVFNPKTGEVAAKVALASTAELRAAVENAKAAQIGWAAKNPQFRARVMMKFLDLAHKHREELATLISMEHGKTVPDALGDLQRGVEVAEFAVGIPHLLKGEFTDGAGPGIDMYSMRQLGWWLASRRSVTRHVPLWNARRHRRGQRLHHEALGARPLLPHAPG
jgi:malonate-semialdehyde dehydrogenase (acetylating)/methylmalonate-semialdehyde dehydrogenase